MLEIKGEDIKDLNDIDLRKLVGLLSEAELRSNKLSTVGVTHGGHQNAPDGGIDVRVECLVITDNNGYLPREVNGFQVKKSDMFRSTILAEMKPDGELRSSIKKLIDNKGSYIIVSGDSSTSDSVLKNRKTAMREAVSHISNNSNLYIDFYDQERIASWVRNHPSLILWIRDKVGRPISGWREYENWTQSLNSITDEYYIDDHKRIYSDNNTKSDGLSVEEGMDAIRSRLQQSRSSIRLVGLSGVGKTRFVQALFDEKIGDHPLNKSSVLYADVGDSLNPDPLTFTEWIQATKIPMVLVIDNCPPDLHRRLTKQCVREESLISLITVEYDIKEDQPEETEVFRLEPSSEELITKILLTRFSQLSQTNAKSIASFSGGNSRMAISLASTVKSGENLSDLKDNDLFLRLFEQRHASDNDLLKAAEVLSLVYSFNRSTENDINELSFLGNLADMSVSEVYRHSTVLKRRELIQQRGMWRAVLPHALANKLASRALENIPLDRICQVFENSPFERFLISFSRRLSYLNESAEAKEIAFKWLSEDGLLRDLSQLDNLGIELFSNIASVDPNLPLEAIEKMTTDQHAETFFSRKNRNYNEFTIVLQSLAYDTNLFPRAIRLLIKFALSEKTVENYNSIRDRLKSLFYLYLSGTHASAQQRLKVIKSLMASSDEKRVELGVLLLEAALQSSSFHSIGHFDFGAWPRDYGYEPRTREDIHNWFKTFIQYSVEVSNSEVFVSEKIKKLLSEEFRGLWVNMHMYDELEQAFYSINKQRFWKDGWIAIRTTKASDKESMDDKTYERLDKLDKKYSPNTLLDQVKVVALSNEWIGYEIIDPYNKTGEIGKEDNYEKGLTLARSLGKDIVNNETIINQLIPEILTNRDGRLFSLGQGMAEGAKDPDKVWNDLCIKMSYIAVFEQDYKLLCGYINRVYDVDKALAEQILDASVTNQFTHRFFPCLQISVKIDKSGVDRLNKSLDLQSSPIWMFRQLASGRRHESINDKELSKLLKKIASVPKGISVALEILTMRLHRSSTEFLVSDSIRVLGQKLILMYEFSRKNKENSGMNSRVEKIIKYCFKGSNAIEPARVVCEKLFHAIDNNDVYAMDTEGILAALASNQSEVFLNVLLESVDKGRFSPLRSVLNNKDPISHLHEDVIVNWCEVSPKKRYSLVASVINPYIVNKSTEKLQWTKLARTLISQFDNPTFILEEFKKSFLPSSWYGSMADAMERRLDLFIDLKNAENDHVRNWANEQKSYLLEDIREFRKSELLRKNERNERFE